MKKQDVQPQPSAKQEGHVSGAAGIVWIKLYSTKGFTARLRAKWKQQVSGNERMLAMETQLIDM